MKRKRILTADGSHSFYIEALNEHYHSVHGAIQESRHVFIEAGLLRFPAGSHISLLEIGFGTGLNAWLTALLCRSGKYTVEYDAVEAWPVLPEEAASLNYPDLVGEKEMRPLFLHLHDCPWDRPVAISSDFSLRKFGMELQSFEPDPGRYDLIYYDAFAPGVQPEMWAEDIFHKLYKSMRPGGSLVTYCAKGTVKRAMQSAGFTVQGMPGPKGKREMTRASK
jgi:tRNA U34 5-methylaminomethyl-2-thiouridine-forming methyltransferase MnmC